MTSPREKRVVLERRARFVAATLSALSPACATQPTPAPPPPASASASPGASPVASAMHEPPPAPVAPPLPCLSVIPLLEIRTVVPFPPYVATPSPDVAPLLDEIAAVLKQHEGVVVEVGGHTDKTELVEVAYARANLVTSALVARGIPRARLKVATYGHTRPVASDDTAAGRAKNRRVELHVLGP